MTSTRVFTREELSTFVKQLVEDGVPLKEIADIIGHSEGDTRRLANGNHRGNTQRRPEIDVLLTGELSLEEIGRRVKPLRPTRRHRHLTYERIEEYLKETEQHDEYMERRKLFLGARTPHYKEFYHMLLLHAHNRGSEENVALQRAVEYKMHGRVHSGLPKLLNLFQTHKDAQDSGNELGRKELAERTGYSPDSVHDIFEALKLKQPPTEKRVTNPPWKIRGIKRAFYSTEPLCDVAYFSEVKDYVVAGIWTYTYGSRVRPSHPVKVFEDGKPLCLHIASQIYLAKDDYGWSEDEIALCLDGRRDLVDYALEHRGSIELRTKSLIDLTHDELK